MEVTDRVYNFSAGPAVLPLQVLERAQRELIVHENNGMSVMEMSHRSKMYEEIIFGAESLFRKLMSVPDSYKVLFLQGGASTQFAMAPLNLGVTGKADYINTGMWAKKAIAEAKRYIDVNVVATSEDRTFSYVPKPDSRSFSKDADYFHITTNNTIYGTRIKELPDTGAVPLVADASSDILSAPRDITKFGLLYAGAQKNLGGPGLTVAVIREELLGKARDITPTMLNYETHAKNDSMYNTPPTYAIYMTKLVLEWLDSLGGVPAISALNEEKAAVLYDFLDNSALFKPVAAREDRSLMNVTFVLPTDELNAAFVKEAADAGFVNLKGHRSVGGMRASIYNAMPKAGIEALVGFMKSFEMNNSTLRPRSVNK